MKFDCEITILINHQNFYENYFITILIIFIIIIVHNIIEVSVILPIGVLSFLKIKGNIDFTLKLKFVTWRHPLHNTCCAKFIC